MQEIIGQLKTTLLKAQLLNIQNCHHLFEWFVRSSKNAQKSSQEDE